MPYHAEETRFDCFIKPYKAHYTVHTLRVQIEWNNGTLRPATHASLTLASTSRDRPLFSKKPTASCTATTVQWTQHHIAVPENLACNHA